MRGSDINVVMKDMKWKSIWCVWMWSNVSLYYFQLFHSPICIILSALRYIMHQYNHSQYHPYIRQQLHRHTPQSSSITYIFRSTLRCLFGQVDVPFVLSALYIMHVSEIQCFCFSVHKCWTCITEIWWSIICMIFTISLQTGWNAAVKFWKRLVAKTRYKELNRRMRAGPR